uniref:Uncharacterized protein n=1 Tax=Anser cygnoides TaxID=8845 RepID=A0A8B9DZ30_ANSCY
MHGRDASPVTGCPLSGPWASTGRPGTGHCLYWGPRGGWGSSMAVWASSTDECPLCPELTWIFLWSRCLARLLSEALALTGIPAFWFSSGIRLVSRVLSLGWKYFRAWKSLWMACPTTILSFKIFRIWRSAHGRNTACNLKLRQTNLGGSCSSAHSSTPQPAGNAQPLSLSFQRAHALPQLLFGSPGTLPTPHLGLGGPEGNGVP